MIYLDTHVVAWLYDAQAGRLSVEAKTAIEEADLIISAMVRLELQYLFEIGRMRDDARTVCAELAQTVNLRVSSVSLDSIVDSALTVNWTRDTFDRLIVAEAQLVGAKLVTKDRVIHDHYPFAVW